MVGIGVCHIHTSPNQIGVAANHKSQMMSSLQRIAVFSVVIVFFICANVFGPGLFWNAYRSEFLQYSAFVATGGLVSEACLLATWVALGAQAVKFRLPLTGALLLAAACSFLIGLQLPEDRMPLDVAIIIFGASVAMYCCMQVPLWIMRAITRRRIDLPEAGSLSAKLESAQFGLRYLMTCTAAVGVLLVLVKHSLPEESMAGGAPWGEIFGVLCVFMIFSALICLPCVWLALTDERRILWAVWLILVGTGGPPLVFGALVTVLGGGPDAAKVIGGIFLFGLGAGGTTFLVLLIARLMGYRLVRAAHSLSRPPTELIIETTPRHQQAKGTSVDTHGCGRGQPPQDPRHIDE
jgi:hypothetical protein